jgi:hypothetical protein
MRIPKLLLLLLLLLAIVNPAMAVLQVNATTIGTTYIEWTWSPGIDLVDMYIDGNVMCGYETTNNTYLLTGLKPNELHSITILNATDSGSNSTRTLTSNVTGGGEGDGSGDMSVGVAVGIVGGLIGVVLIARKKEKSE